MSDLIIETTKFVETPWPVATFTPPPLLMWSATNRVVHAICTHFFPHYYVWCSPVFEGEAVSRYERGYGQPPSSDPATIYRSLFAAASKGDEHNEDVKRQRAKLEKVALDLLAAEKIEATKAREVVEYLKGAHISEWKPMIYAIPYGAVHGRVLEVPRAHRASGRPEYVIPDLNANEFQPIEPMLCS